MSVKVDTDYFRFRFVFKEHIAEVIASGAKFEDESEDDEYIIPPDNLMARRMSCF